LEFVQISIVLELKDSLFATLIGNRRNEEEILFYIIKSATSKTIKINNLKYGNKMQVYFLIIKYYQREFDN